MLSPIRTARVAATSTATSGVALLAAAVPLDLPGLGVLGAAATVFAAASLVTLRPRHRARLRTRVEVLTADALGYELRTDAAGQYLAAGRAA